MFEECNWSVAQNGPGYIHLSRHVNDKHRTETTKMYEKRIKTPNLLFRSFIYPSKTRSVHA